MSGRVEYDGVELATVLAPSADDCAAYCESQSVDDCRFWTWNVNYSCSLKSKGMGKKESDDGVISGIRIGLDFAVEFDRAYESVPGERTLQNIIYIEPWRCQLACIRDASCTHFEQVNATNNSQLPSCVLKPGAVPASTTVKSGSCSGSVLVS